MGLSRASWVAISGVLWLVVGIGLMTLGLNFVVHTAQFSHGDTTSWIAKLDPLAGGREQAALVLVAIGLIIGFIKGRFVLVKSVKRVVTRILSLPLPLKLSQVYHPAYLALIGSMVFIGMALKWLNLPMEVRGTIDIAIGSALINGSLLYFRAAFAVHKETKTSS
jgi:hypothetical protein